MGMREEGTILPVEEIEKKERGGEERGSRLAIKATLALDDVVEDTYGIGTTLCHPS